MKLVRHFGWSGSSQAQIRQAAQDRFEHHRGLDPSQLGAEAEMDAAAKGQRAQILARDVEPVRIFEHIRVAIGRADQRNDDVPFVAA